MVDKILNSYGLTLGYLRRLVDDVPDAELARQPNGVVNHPAWVIGHLTHSCEAIAGELGLQPWLPENWNRQYGTGSVPTADRSAYPTKAELLAMLSDAQARFSEQLVTLGDDGHGSSATR